MALTSAGNSPYRGNALENPFAKPELVLTDGAGQPFDLRKQTAGKTTLVFFGYTNCPDVCPTTVGDISVALAKQTAEVRDSVRVVFVTTDPERDTPESLKKWLAGFGPNFTGLSGDLERVKKAALSLGISVEDPKRRHDGTVTSAHGAQVAASLLADDKAHVVYTSGTTVEDFAHDLPLLAKSTR
ncbi:SCO family protein [Streptomyces sp. NPDC048389]|uniref:SCO family protein n=1 Tax=Streptomyces sp. NPDC048389 TaxID=3154622 RepID=UPI00345559D5